jgi:hypothetical protein
VLLELLRLTTNTSPVQWGEIIASGAAVAAAGALVKLSNNVSKLEQQVSDHLSMDHNRRERWTPEMRLERTGHK